MITFSYTISDILEKCKMLTIYKASALIEPSPDMADDIMLADEDTALFTKYLKTAASNIAYILSGYTKNLVDVDSLPLAAFAFDVASSGTIVFRVNMPLTFNTGMTDLLDEAINNALENFTLMKIAKLRGLDFAVYQESYEDARSAIRGYLAQRTAPINGGFSFY